MVFEMRTPLLGLLRAAVPLSAIIGESVVKVVHYPLQKAPPGKRHGASLRVSRHRRSRYFFRRNKPEVSKTHASGGGVRKTRILVHVSDECRFERTTGVARTKW